MKGTYSALLLLISFVLHQLNPSRLLLAAPRKLGNASDLQIRAIARDFRVWRGFHRVLRLGRLGRGVSPVVGRCGWFGGGSSGIGSESINIDMELVRWIVR